LINKIKVLCLTIYADKVSKSLELSAIIEMDEIMRSIKVSIDNASIITNELAEFTYKMNNKWCFIKINHG
jgi:hypothetical protein